MAGSQVEIMANCVDKQRLGYQAISLTHMADVSEPQIALGSKVEIGDALFEFTGNESITGWSGIAVSSAVYIKLTVSGTSVTASFTITAPTWDTAKQGWYDDSDRYIGGLYKDGTGQYTKKWLYRQCSGGVQNIKEYGDGAFVSIGSLDQGNNGRFTKKKTIDIGDWNMDTTAQKLVPHGLTLSKIIGIEVIIRVDTNGYLYPIAFSGLGYSISGLWRVNETNIILDRFDSQFFDTGYFSSTSYNRGFIKIEYEE